MNTAIRRGLSATVVALAVYLSAAGAQAGTLTVYSGADEALVTELIPVFRAKHPDIDLQMIRDSGGAIVARLLAEKDSPRADAIFTLPANALVLLDQQGMLEPYRPADFDELKPGMRDEVNPVPTWVAQDAWTNAICFNTTEAGDLPPPQSWKDLADPKYRGKIVMPDPGSSGTALTMVANWLQVMGEEEGWKFMAALDHNVTQYVHSGSAPCRMAARGETLIGLSYPYPGVKEINQGAPLQVILPPEGNGAEVEGNAIVKGSKNVADAQKLIDFMMSEEAQQITAKYLPVVARKGVHADIPNYPAEEEARMRLIDYTWLADHKQALLDEWKNRFGSKSAPKN